MLRARYSWWKRIVAAVLIVLAVAIATLYYSFFYWPLHPRLTVPVAGKLELDGVTIVSTADGSLQPNMAIRIMGGRIVEIAATDAIEPDPSFRKVTAAGKFVVPGYNDMHNHVLNNYDPGAVLALMLSDGVTGFRQMSGSPRLLQERAEGRLPIGAESPALLQIPGGVLTPLNARTEPEMRAEIDRQKKQGVDFIKVGALTGPVFAAALDEAKRVGLPILGHLQVGLDPREASNRGFRSIEHIGPREPLLIACSANEAPLFKEAAGDYVLRTPDSANFLYQAYSIFSIVRNPMWLVQPKYLARVRSALDSYDAAKCRALAELFKKNDTWNVPTLVNLNRMELLDSPGAGSDEIRKLIPEKAFQAALDERRATYDKLTARQRETLRMEYARQGAMARLFDAVGVPMMTGTDNGGKLQTKYSLLDEFDELAKAGISPLHILQMTTRNPAVYLGKTATMGSIAPGKNADLVVLDANPLEGVANFRKIHGVVRAGRYFAKADLDRLHYGQKVALNHLSPSYP